MSDIDNKKHSTSCACGHDHSHDHGKCACGHDHAHEHGKCSCNHDHDHDQMDGTCICGHNHKEEGGVGHDRAMGKIFFVLFGGILTLNSFILDWTMPQLEFSSELSALLGAFILALPIIITAVKDLINGKVYMNELVALAILAAFAEEQQMVEKFAALYNGDVGHHRFLPAGDDHH